MLFGFVKKITQNLSPSFSDTKDIKLNLEAYETLHRSLWTRKEVTGIRLRWNVVPGVQNVKIPPYTLSVEGVA